MSARFFLSEDCRFVADEELEGLEIFKIEYKNRKWEWKGGILSGWRMTSFLRLIVNQLVGTYIIREMGLEGAVDVGLGDDIILYGSEFMMD